MRPDENTLRQRPRLPWRKCGDKLVEIETATNVEDSDGAGEARREEQRRGVLNNSRILKIKSSSFSICPIQS